MEDDQIKTLWDNIRSEHLEWGLELGSDPDIAQAFAEIAANEQLLTEFEREIRYDQ